MVCFLQLSIVWVVKKKRIFYGQADLKTSVFDKGGGNAYDQPDCKISFFYAFPKILLEKVLQSFAFLMKMIKNRLVWRKLVAGGGCWIVVYLSTTKCMY